MHTVIAALFLSAWPLGFAAPDGFGHWSGESLTGVDRSLDAKNSAMIGTQVLGRYSSHAIQISRREGSGEAELHETQADVFFVKGGAATLIVGGTIVEPRDAGPHEVRGRAIVGGDRVKLSAGDVVHIPPRTPHQLLLRTGAHFSYVVVKVDSN